MAAFTGSFEMRAPDEQDEDEIEYGKWIERTAEEALAGAREAVPQLEKYMAALE
jgi:hypothetical protein